MSFRPGSRRTRERRLKEVPSLAAPGESSMASVHALRPPSGPRSIVLDVRGPIARTAVTGLCERVRVLPAEAPPDVQDLLVLTGLCEQLPCGGGLRVEPHRQVEQR